MVILSAAKNPSCPLLPAATVIPGLVAHSATIVCTRAAATTLLGYDRETGGVR